MRSLRRVLIVIPVAVACMAALSVTKQPGKEVRLSTAAEVPALPGQQKPSAPATPSVGFQPLLPDIPNCVGTGGYAVKPPVGDGTLRIYVNADRDLSGAIAVLSGSSGGLANIVAAKPTKLFLGNEQHGVARWSRDASSAPEASLQSKRMPEADFNSLVAAVSTGSAQAPPGFVVLDSLPTSVEILGTACEVGETFYGVEVIRGDLSSRAEYMLSLDPVKVVTAGDVSIAMFGPSAAATTRPATPAEWSQLTNRTLPETGKSALPREVREATGR